MYGLYHITYEDIRNYEVKCTSCSKQFPVTVKASDTFNAKLYEGKNVIRERIKVDLPGSPGVSTLLKQPTLFDDLSNMKSLMHRQGSTLELIIKTLIIDSFEQDVEDIIEPVRSRVCTFWGGSPCGTSPIEVNDWKGYMKKQSKLDSEKRIENEVSWIKCYTTEIESKQRTGFRNITMFNPEMSPDLIKAIGKAISKLSKSELNTCTYNDIILKAHKEM